MRTGNISQLWSPHSFRILITGISPCLENSISNPPLEVTLWWTSMPSRGAKTSKTKFLKKGTELIWNFQRGGRGKWKILSVGRSMDICWGLPCDGLASHPGGSRNTPCCYCNWDKLWKWGATWLACRPYLYRHRASASVYIMTLAWVTIAHFQSCRTHLPPHPPPPPSLERLYIVRSKENYH